MPLRFDKNYILFIIKKREKDELKTSYIIFINTFDLFGKGFPKYTFENICQESSDLHLDDGAVKVFINAKSTIPGMSPELQGFLRYLCGENPDTPLTDRIQNEVVKSRNNVRWERIYMLLEEKYKAFSLRGVRKDVSLVWRKDVRKVARKDA